MPGFIRSRLVLLALTWLLPATLVGAWYVHATALSQRESEERALRETTRGLARLVEKELAQRAVAARVLASSHWLDRLPALSPRQAARFEQQARQAMQGFEGWVELRDARGLLLSTRAGHLTGPEAAPRMAPVAVGGAPPAPRDLPAASLPQDGDLPWHAELATPVERHGVALATLVVTVLPAEMQRVVDGGPLPPGWTTTVFDAQQTIVARRPHDLAAVGRRVEHVVAGPESAAADGRGEARAVDGTHRIAHVDAAAHGWSTRAEMPMPPFGGYLSAAALHAAFAVLLLLAAGLAGASWAWRGITQSFHSLRRAATALQDTRAALERDLAAARERVRGAEQRIVHSRHAVALGRLTGRVAHDFNNLLGVIGNSGHLLQRHAGDPGRAEAALAATRRAVQRGSRLTRQLARFAARRALPPQAVDLARYLPGLEELVRCAAGRRIDVRIAVEPGTHPVCVDCSELELAVVNLVLNARDAMPRGGVLWLQARNAPAAPTRHLAAGVLITVRDTGHGKDLAGDAPPGEPASRAAGAVRQSGAPALRQVQAFSTQAGGTAWLASAPGAGTTVSLLLPAAGEASDAAAAAPASAEAHDGAGAPGGDEHDTGTRCGDERAAGTRCGGDEHTAAGATRRSVPRACALPRRRRPLASRQAGSRR